MKFKQFLSLTKYTVIISSIGVTWCIGALVAFFVLNFPEQTQRL